MNKVREKIGKGHLSRPESGGGEPPYVRGEGLGLKLTMRRVHPHSSTRVVLYNSSRRTG